MRRALAIGSIGTLLWLLLAPGTVAAGDGALRWRTIDTPHFQVHYPAGLEAVAFRTARYCEEAHEVLGPILEHTPRQRVQVRVTDFGDSANGSATAIPYPQLNIFAAPPALDSNLNDYDDWLRLLIFHEYVHILHLDTISGVPAWLNAIFGRTAAPNQNAPSFHLEGVAVWLESATSGRGRIRSATFRGYLRAMALADRLHSIDAATHAPLDFPGANVWYMYGGHFIDWVVRRRGAEGVARMNRAFGDELIPYGLNRAATEGFGDTFTELWAAWQADLVAQARATVAGLRADGGITPLSWITTGGRSHVRPRIRADGALVSLSDDGRSPDWVYERPLRPADAVDVATCAEHGACAAAPEPARTTPRFAARDRLADLDGARNIDLCSDDRTLLFDRSDRWRGVYGFLDLHRFDLATGAQRRLTAGARVREPACAPGAAWAAAVQGVAGRTRLVRVDLSTGALDVLHDPGRLGQMAFPAVSPDGRTVVAVRVDDTRGRDLVAYDTRTRTVRNLTRDDALELHPRFTPDGRWLLYASDRTGIFQIYARAWPEGPTVRVTQVVTGAMDPVTTRDGEHLVVGVLTADGTDLAVAPFRPETPYERLSSDGAPAGVLRDPGDRPLPSRPYAPWGTLWPVSWSPTVSFTNVETNTNALGLTVEAADALAHHIILGDFSTPFDDAALSSSVAYSYTRLVPNFGASLSYAPRVRANGLRYASTDHPLRENVTRAAGSVSLPFQRAGHRASASVRYSWAIVEPAENPDPVHDPFDDAPVLPEPVDSASLTFSLTYSNTERYTLSISGERGRRASVSLRTRDPRLGGERTTGEVLWSYTEYVPLWARHALGLKLNGAVSRGGVNYALGGAPQRNLLLDALDGIFLGTGFLRGYEQRAAIGDRYLLATAEYRMPVWDIFGGPSTAPLFLRRLKLAAFSDWGQARDDSFALEPDGWKRSVGGEIVSEATLGWRLPFSGRVGYAHGFDEGGEHQFYFFLGNWF